MGKSVSPSKWTSTIRIALVSVAVSFGLVCAICFNDIVPTIGGISFSSGAQLDSVLVANSVRSNSRGLMHQTELNRNEGMLFLLPEMSTEHRFWMKDTPIPLDIVYLDDSSARITNPADPHKGKVFAAEGVQGPRNADRLRRECDLALAQIAEVVKPKHKHLKVPPRTYFLRL